MRTDRLLKREHIILAIIIITAFMLRFYGVLVDVHLFFREATYEMAAWRIVDGDMPYRDFYHAQAPFSPFLLAFIFLIFGVGIVQARLFIVSFTTFTTFIIFLAGKRINYKTGLLGSLIFAIIPKSVQYGMTAVNDFIAMTFCIVGYYFLISVIIDDKDKRINSSSVRNNLILAGLLVSVGVMVKIIVAPIFLAFIAILIIEGKFNDVKITDQIKQIAFLSIGFIILILFVFLSFYLSIGDEFIAQVLGQHLSKGSSTWKLQWSDKPVVYLILENYYFFVFFALSIPFAIRKSYGRGLLICILFMVFTVFLFVPKQYENYYHINIIFMAMISGFFPLPAFKSLNLKLAILTFIVIINSLLFKIYRRFNYNATTLAFLVSSIALIAFIVILILERKFVKIETNDSEKNASSSYKISELTILKRLKGIFNDDTTKLIIGVSLIVLIATTGVLYPRLSEIDMKTIDWVKANTSSDDYILSDDLKINFRSLRRSPFAEISKDRTFLGELTGEMCIEACYEFNIRVVVNTDRLFGKYDTYNVFLEFLEENYVPINEGHTIYIRSTPLQ